MLDFEERNVGIFDRTDSNFFAPKLSSFVVEKNYGEMEDLSTTNGIIAKLTNLIS